MKKKATEYVITYRSREHYEVLGWVKASSVDEAIRKARAAFKDDIGRYDINNATIGEWRGIKSFRFFE